MWVCSRFVSCWLKVLIGHRVSINSVVEWHNMRWNLVPEIVRFREILELCWSSKEQLFWLVSGPHFGFSQDMEKKFPLSVDLSDFWRCFRVESNTTIKIYIGHDVLLINEVHNVNERNSVFEMLTTIGYKIIFWTQSRMNCNLCEIIRRDLGFIVLHIVSCKGKSYSISTKLDTDFWP